MTVILRDGNMFLLRFDPGEEVLAGLAEFSASESVHTAHFSGIGAAGEVVLSYYDLERKKYRDTDWRERVEIISLSGNVALMDSGTVIHAHGSFSTRDYGVRAGHVKKLVVSATCEIVLQKLEGAAERSYDETTGLNLLKETD